MVSRCSQLEQLINKKLNRADLECFWLAEITWSQKMTSFVLYTDFKNFLNIHTLV